MLTLRPRLKAAADMVTAGRTVVDIGTDHAYLPAYLLLSGITPRAVAGDIGIQPLENAAETVKLYGLSDSISLRVSDGLAAVAPEEAQEITICGMGGTLIAEILEKADCLSRNTHLILQPMTHAEDVRRWLCENSFAIDREVCVADSGRVYCCISAFFSEQKQSFEPGYYYFGTLSGNTPEERAMIKKTADRVRTRERSIREADRFPEEQAYLRRVLSYYESEFDNDGKRRI